MAARASSAPTPDWVALADGRLHRLRAGRDYSGDVRGHIRQARQVAAQLDRHVVLSRDDLGNSSFLWVQFLDGVVGEAEACPGCGEPTLGLLTRGLARCDTCGRSYAVGGAVAPGRETPEERGTDDRQARAVLRRAGALSAPARPPQELLSDSRFLRVAATVHEAGATQFDLERLWTFWQAAGAAAQNGGAIVAVGSELTGSAAFLAVALHELGGDGCVLVEHPRFAGQERRLDGELVGAVRHLLDEVGVQVVHGGLEEALALLPGQPVGAAHLDVLTGAEASAALGLLDPVLAVGAAVVVESVEVGAAAGTSGADRAAGIEQFLASSKRYLSWQSASHQRVLVRLGD